jgi:hypothetical protein
MARTTGFRIMYGQLHDFRLRQSMLSPTSDQLMPNIRSHSVEVPLTNGELMKVIHLRRLFGGRAPCVIFRKALRHYYKSKKSKILISKLHHKRSALHVPAKTELGKFYVRYI